MASEGKNEYEEADFAEFELDIPEKKSGKVARRIAKYVGDMDMIPLAVQMEPGYDGYKVYVSSAKEISRLLNRTKKLQISTEADTPFRRLLMKCDKIVKSRLLMRFFKDHCQREGLSIMMEKKPRKIQFELSVAEELKGVIKFLEDYQPLRCAYFYGTNDKKDCDYIEVTKLK